jgi:hypothetical protein
MRQYAVSAIVAGKNIEDVVIASSASDAIAVVRARYGGNVTIFGARIIG